MWKEIRLTAISSILSVSLLFILTRFIGKKQRAQLTFFDYVIGITIGSIAGYGVVDESIHIAAWSTGLIICTLFSIIISYISKKSYVGRKLLNGTPFVLIENGKIIEESLKRSRLNINDLLEECRQKDVFDIAEIEFAILETTGKLSILLKSANQPLTLKDMNIEATYKGLCASVVIDGKIIENHLQIINLDRSWLLSELAKNSINNYEDVLFAYVDNSGNLVVHLKNVKLTNKCCIM